MAGNWPAKTVKTVIVRRVADMSVLAGKNTCYFFPFTVFSSSSSSSLLLSSFSSSKLTCSFHSSSSSSSLPSSSISSLPSSSISSPSSSSLLKRSVHNSSSFPLLPSSSSSSLPSSFSSSLIKRSTHSSSSVPLLLPSSFSLPSSSSRPSSSFSSSLPSSSSSSSFSSSLPPSSSFSTSPLRLKTRPIVDAGSPQSTNVNVNSPTITLIDPEDKVLVLPLDKAEKVAKRRDLKLVKVDDPSLGRSGKLVYRLMTGKQYFEEQRRTKTEKKGGSGSKEEKMLSIGGNISLHDLTIKLHSVTRWINKGHQVKVTITTRKSTPANVENVFSTIEEEVKKVKGRVLQRHEKADDIRFYIAPAKEKKQGVAAAAGTTHSEAGQSDDSGDNRA